MTTRAGLELIIDNHIASWVAIPCKLYRDNTPVRNQDDTEWMRLTVGDGFSFVNESAGLLDVRGSTDANPFILTFDVFTEYNAGTLRAAEIAGIIKDRWAYRSIDDVHFDSASTQRVGEESKIYHTAVIISAVRYETLDPLS